MDVDEFHTRLCNRCRDLFTKMENLKEDEVIVIKPYHTDRKELQQSLESGCVMCTNLSYQGMYLHECYESDWLRLEGVSPDNFYIQYGSQPYPCNLTSHFRLRKVENDKPFFQSCADASKEAYTNSDTTLAYALTLLHRCLASHQQCVPNLKPSSYPARLLLVDDNTIRLIDTRKTTLECAYATLSHTWGNAEFKILTAETLPAFTSGIDVEALPATFRDTVEVVRHLGIQYLWIDCYCIVQSSEEHSDETRDEIARMGEIYSNAILNIGAAAAKSPLDGLFVTREPTRMVRINFTLDDQSRCSSYFISDEGQPYREMCRFEHSAHNSTFRRAWCLQERMLCQRMLHFCDHRLWWQCDSVERGADIVPMQSNYMSAHTFSVLPPDEDFSDLQRVTQWHDIVTRYTSMELSRPQQDKFAACSAVAKVIADRTGWDYIAGHFRQNLISSLPWFAYPDSNPSSKWRAPSWSWASMDGPIEMVKFDQGTPCVEIIDIHCKPVESSNPYGALLSASMTVKGLTAIVSAGRDHGPRDMWPGQPVSRLYVPGPQGEQIQFEYYRDSLTEIRGNLTIMITSVTATDSDDFSMLTAGELLADLAGARKSGLFSGLVLAPVDSQKSKIPQVYRRVGSFQTQASQTIGFEYDRGINFLGWESYEWSAQRREIRIIEIV